MCARPYYQIEAVAGCPHRPSEPQPLSTAAKGRSKTVPRHPQSPAVEKLEIKQNTQNKQVRREEEVSILKSNFTGQFQWGGGDECEHQSSGDWGRRAPRLTEVDLDLVRRCLLGRGPDASGRARSSGGSSQFGMSIGAWPKKEKKSGSWSGSASTNLPELNVTLMLKGWPHV